MRKFLMTLAVLTGAATVAPGANATQDAAVVVPSIHGPVMVEGTLLQPVQYREDWRFREQRRREDYERFRRHEERVRWHRVHDGYGRW